MVIQKAKEAGDLMYLCLLEAQWEVPFAEAGARMIQYHNKEVQMYEYEGILEDQRDKTIRQSLKIWKCQSIRMASIEHQWRQKSGSQAY